MRVLIRADASTTIGAGHVIRCLALAQNLRTRGAAVRFICRPLGGNLIWLLRSKGFPVHELQIEAPKPEAQLSMDVHQCEVSDARGTLRSLHATEFCDWLVVDHYSLNHRWEAMLRPICKRLFVIDDLALKAHDCDLLLNQNPLPDLPARYAGRVPPNCQVLFGPEYALLDPTFAQLRQVAKRKFDVPKTLLVSMGGADKNGATMFVLNAIQEARASHLHVEVVVGSANPDKTTIKQFCVLHGNATYHEQTDQMPKLIAQADVAIGAGGISQWERCCLGLPSIVIAIADIQEETMRSLAEKEACIYLGPANALDIGHLARKVDDLLANEAQRRTMSESGLALVDGHGAERVVRAIHAQS